MKTKNTFAIINVILVSIMILFMIVMFSIGTIALFRWKIYSGSISMSSLVFFLSAMFFDGLNIIFPVEEKLRWDFKDL